MQDIESSSAQLKAEIARVEHLMAQLKSHYEQQTKQKLVELEDSGQRTNRELFSLKSKNDEKEAELREVKSELENLESLVKMKLTERRGKLTPKVESEDLESVLPSELLERIKIKDKLAKDLSKAVQMYERRTGLLIKRLDNGCIQVNFRCITREKPDLLHSLTVRVNSARLYEVDHTSHPLPDLPQLLQELNETNEFSRFIREVRSRFVQLYA